MILADSSVLIAWQRTPSIQTYYVMTRYHAGICGITVAELLAGARNPAERAQTMNLFSSFARVPIDEAIRELAGDLSARLRSRGTPLMVADLAIAATAIHHGLPVWTRDKHFVRVQGVFPALSLFDETSA